MLTIYAHTGSCLVRRDDIPVDLSPDASLWLDLLDPTPAEDHAVERIMGVSVPTRAEMLEIEASSRLYEEHGAVYMTATLLCRADSGAPITTPVTFILAGKRLCTVRYDEPRPFAMFETRATKPGGDVAEGRAILLGLLDAVIDRLADILELIGAEVDRVSSLVFDTAATRSGPAVPQDYARVIRAIGQQNTLVSKVQESLVSLMRLFLFLGEVAGRDRNGKEEKAHLKTLVQDARSLAEHAQSLDSKLDFLLNATLGLVSLQQNTIVKIFSVLAVVFMPPTLIASIYGMNFHTMPELDWQYGYPYALGLMVASVAITFAVFKWKRWL